MIAHMLTKPKLRLERLGLTYPVARPKNDGNPCAELQDVLHIVNIKVRSSHRNRGIGTELVSSVLLKHNHHLVCYEASHQNRHVISSFLLGPNPAAAYSLQDQVRLGQYRTTDSTAHRFYFEKKRGQKRHREGPSEDQRRRSELGSQC